MLTLELNDSCLKLHSLGSTRENGHVHRLTRYSTAGASAASTGWRDPSPHNVRFVTVESSVKLEVLDWGGRGQPILFIGCYLTGHVYDDVGPKLTDQFHVYPLMRRGVGASDRPTTGYDPQRRAADAST